MNYDEKLATLMDLIKLFVKLLFFAHVIACIWFYLGTLTDSNERTWMTLVKDLQIKGNSYYYLISLYWAITTITTTGYGDITPKNEGEYFFNLIVMILGSIYFAYSLNYMGHIFSKFSKDDDAKK